MNTEDKNHEPRNHRARSDPGDDRILLVKKQSGSDEEQQSELEQKREKSCEFEHSPSLHPCIPECTDFKLFFRVLSGLRQKVPEPLLDEHTE